LRRIGGILLAIGLGILICWALYWFLSSAFAWLPLPVKIAITAIAAGLILLLASLIREKHRTAKEDKDKFRGIEK